MKNAIKAIIAFLTEERVLTTRRKIVEREADYYAQGLHDGKPRRGFKGRFVSK